MSASRKAGQQTYNYTITTSGLLPDKPPYAAGSQFSCKRVFFRSLESRVASISFDVAWIGVFPDWFIERQHLPFLFRGKKSFLWQNELVAKHPNSRIMIVACECGKCLPARAPTSSRQTSYIFSKWHDSCSICCCLLIRWEKMSAMDVCCRLSSPGLRKTEKNGDKTLGKRPKIPTETWFKVCVNIDLMNIWSFSSAVSPGSWDRNCLRVAVDMKHFFFDEINFCGYPRFWLSNPLALWTQLKLGNDPMTCL